MIQKRHRLLLVFFAGFCLTAAAVLWAWALHRPAVTRPNYEKIRDRMTVDEVAALMGRPPDAHLPGRCVCDPWPPEAGEPVNAAGWFLRGGPPPECKKTLTDWRYEAGLCAVWLDESGRVIGKEWEDDYAPGFFTRLRRKLGL